MPFNVIPSPCGQGSLREGELLGFSRTSRTGFSKGGGLIGVVD